MAAVKFFGLIRLEIKQSSMEIEAGSIDELLEIVSMKSGMKIEELRDSIIFVNGTNIAQLKGLKTHLESGDEVQMFSPVLGG